MKIYDVKTGYKDNYLLLTAKCKIRRFGYDKAYFKIDKKYENFVYSDASPFAAALLIPSMKQGEDLVIEGSISEELYHSMKSIINIFLSWEIGLKPIKIKANVIDKDLNNPGSSASFFSGGVDSFYTYLKHKKGKEKIEYLILINGFDIGPKNKKLWKTTFNNIQQLAVEEKIKLIAVQSNIRRLIEPIFPWSFTHGGCLASVGLLLRNHLKHIYIPSTDEAEAQTPWGSHLDTDKLWSTEKTLFVHDGVEASRNEKVAWITARSSLVQKYLRVCYSNKKEAYNCCQCDKCLRTMINLQYEGVLDKVKTFPEKIDPIKVARLIIQGEENATYHRDNLAELKKRSLYPELQEAIKVCLKNVQHSQPKLKSAISKIVYLDHIYAHGYMYKMISAILRKY